MSEDGGCVLGSVIILIILSAEQHFNYSHEGKFEGVFF